SANVHPVTGPSSSTCATRVRETQTQTAFLQRHQATRVECARLISEITGGAHIDPHSAGDSGVLGSMARRTGGKAASHPEGGSVDLRSVHNVMVVPNWRCCWAKEGCTVP